ncbi:MAG TPA: C1 family peptidase, partial [bacterium]|nr:C1 family peptidase [bacterium]
MKRLLTAMIALAIAAFAAGCGGGGGGGGADRGAITNQNVELAAVRDAISAQNAQWTAAENPISQLPAARRRLLNGDIEPSAAREEADRETLRAASDAAQIPASLDWRNKNGANWLTPVRNQQECGSCVAHASLGVTEALIKITNDNPNLDKDLSESDLFSCGGAMCATGWSKQAAAERLKNTGVVEEACLPYQPKDNMCASKC